MNILDNLLIQCHPKIFLFQVLPQTHQKLVLRRVRDLRCAKADIQQIFPHGARQDFLQQAEILIRFIFRHNTGTLFEFRYDLILAVHIAAVNGCHIAAVTADSAPDLANFLFVHNSPFHVLRRRSAPA